MNNDLFLRLLSADNNRAEADDMPTAVESIKQLPDCSPDDDDQATKQIFSKPLETDGSKQVIASAYYDDDDDDDDDEGESEKIGDRCYLTDIRDLDSLVPTKEMSFWWLQYNNPEFKLERASFNFEHEYLEQEVRGQRQKDLDHEKLLKYAVENQITSGKWIIKATEEHVDEVWKLLVTDGSLCNIKGGGETKNASRGPTDDWCRNWKLCVKCSSKVMSDAYSPSKLYTLCLYIEEGFVRRQRVMKIRTVMHDLGIDMMCAQPMFFKPELYTYLPFEGHTYLWIDGEDTDYWCDHWKGKEDSLFLRY